MYFLGVYERIILKLIFGILKGEETFTKYATTSYTGQTLLHGVDTLLIVFSSKFAPTSYHHLYTFYWIIC